MVRAQSRWLSPPARRVVLAVLHMYVQHLFHSADAGDLPRNQSALSGRWIFHQRLAVYRGLTRVLLRKLPPDLRSVGWGSAGGDGRVQFALSQVLPGLHGSRARNLATLGPDCA